MSGDKKTLAITGATGFVGGHLLNLAVKSGFHIRALTRRAQDDRPGVTWIKGALDNPSGLANICDGADVVIHIAGVVNAPTRTEFEAGNVNGTLAVVEAAKNAGIPRFIHVSSLAATLPDLSIYGDTKAKAEKIVAASGLDWTIIRPPWVYGPGDTDTLDMFKTAKWGFVPLPPDADGKLSAIHVDDLSRALLAAVPKHEDMTAQIFEVDDGQPGGWTQSAFAKAIGLAMGRRVKPVAIPRGVMNVAAFADRLVRRGKAKLTQDRVSYFCHDDWTIDPQKRLPEHIWTPRIGSKEGLEETAKWYRRNDWV